MFEWMWRGSEQRQGFPVLPIPPIWAKVSRKRDEKWRFFHVRAILGELEWMSSHRNAVHAKMLNLNGTRLAAAARLTDSVCTLNYSVHNPSVGEKRLRRCLNTDLRR